MERSIFCVIPNDASSGRYKMFTVMYKSIKINFTYVCVGFVKSFHESMVEILD